MDKLDIKKFNHNNICIHPTIVILSKRGGGKSTIIRSLLDSMRESSSFIIFSPSEKTDPFFSKFIPESYIYYEVTSRALQKIITRQSILKQKLEKRHEEGKSEINIDLVVVFDDCLASAMKWKKDSNLREIMMNGRHFFITFIIALQDPMGLPHDLRPNFDYVFLLKDRNLNNRPKYYKNYSSGFPDEKTFSRIYDKITSVKYNCMVMVNNDRDGIERDDNNFLEYVYHYKADPIDIDILSCKQLIQFNKRNYNKNWNSMDTMRRFISDHIDKKIIDNFKVQLTNQNIP